MMTWVATMGIAQRLAPLAFLLLAPAGMLNAQSRNMEICWIDVEGGAATLIVSPSGESLLVDAGNPVPPDRDPKRILATVQFAGLKKIDYLMVTHFHLDHVGGARQHDPDRAFHRSWRPDGK